MKAELRKKILQEMKAIPREQKQFIDQALTERLLHHGFYDERISDRIRWRLL